jgi:hypothetical protein
MRLRFNAMIGPLIPPLTQRGPGMLFPARLVAENGGMTAL